MLLTRNSKRLAGKQNANYVAKIPVKCEEFLLNEIIKENKRTLNRACKQILPRDILKEKNKFHEETCVSKKVSPKRAMKLSENKPELQKGKNKKLKIESKTKKVHTSDKNKRVDKENNLCENKMSLPLSSKLGETKTNNTRKITNYFPLKTISDNVVCRIPVWAVNKNLPQTQTKKKSRLSDIYNFEKDENFLNEPSPVKKKKIARKPQTTKNKKNSKKIVSSHTSHKDKFSSVKAAKPAGQLMILEGFTIKSHKIDTFQTNSTKARLQAMEKPQASGIISVLEPIYPVPEHIDSVHVSKSCNVLRNTEMLLAEGNAEILDEEDGYVQNCVIPRDDMKSDESDSKHRVKSDGFVEGIINDCYSSFVNMDDTIPLREAVTKCLDKISKDSKTVKCTKKSQNKFAGNAKDCHSSSSNMDTSFQEYVEKNNAELRRTEKTPEKYYVHKTHSEIHKKLNNSDDVPLFLIPKMTSTPENADNPVIQPVKHISKNRDLKLSEMSAIPCAVSRNIQFELSEVELSPIKPVSENKENDLFQSPSKECLENKNPENEKGIYMGIRNSNNLKENTDMKVLKSIQLGSANNNGTKSKETYLCNKNSAKENARNTHKIALFESPERGEADIKKAKKLVPTNKAKKNIFTEENISSPDENYHFIEVLKPVSFYQSPHQAKKPKTRTKAALNAPKRIKDNKEANCHPKKHIKRTKTACYEQKKNKDREVADDLPKNEPAISGTRADPGVKQKTKEQNEAQDVDKLMESLNKHFFELENMDLCIE